MRRCFRIRRSSASDAILRVSYPRWFRIAACLAGLRRRKVAVSFRIRLRRLGYLDFCFRGWERPYGLSSPGKRILWPRPFRGFCYGSSPHLSGGFSMSAFRQSRNALFFPKRIAIPSHHCPKDLALLCRLCRRGHLLAAARQLSGRLPEADGHADKPHEYRLGMIIRLPPGNSDT